MSIELFYESLTNELREEAYRFRSFILNDFPFITEEYKWRIPYFYYKRKGVCFFHCNKANGLYLGFAKGQKLIDESGILTGNELKIMKHYLFKDNNFQEEELRSFIVQSIDIIDAELESKNSR